MTKSPNYNDPFPPMFNLSTFPDEYFDSLKVNFLTSFETWPPTTLGLLFEGAMNFGSLIEEEEIVPSNPREEELLDELYTFATEYVLSEVEEIAIEMDNYFDNPKQVPFFTVKDEETNESVIIVNNDFYSPEEVLSDLDNPLLTTFLCFGLLNFITTVEINEKDIPKWIEAWHAVLITLESFLLPEWKERLNQIGLE